MQQGKHPDRLKKEDKKKILSCMEVENDQLYRASAQTKTGTMYGT